MSEYREQECLNRAKDLMFQNGDSRLLNYFQEAVPNIEASKFPDFIFEGGYIEHFKVYTSKENRNGAEQGRAENEFEKEIKTKLEQQTEECLQSPLNSEIVVNEYEMTAPEYSYEHFVESFKRNFEKHINSLEKYSGEKTNGIFLIESEGGRIKVVENSEFKEFYRLQYDKDILEYLYQYTDVLQYVVFLQNESYEILKLSVIPQILARAPKDVNFGVGRYIKKIIHVFMT